MDNPFHYDQTHYQEEVARIAKNVVSNPDAIPTLAPRAEVDVNSYHATAIKQAEQERMSRLYPRRYA